MLLAMRGDHDAFAALAPPHAGAYHPLTEAGGRGLVNRPRACEAPMASASPLRLSPGSPRSVRAPAVEDRSDAAGGSVWSSKRSSRRELASSMRAADSDPGAR